MRESAEIWPGTYDGVNEVDHEYFRQVLEGFALRPDCRRTRWSIIRDVIRNIDALIHALPYSVVSAASPVLRSLVADLFVVHETLPALQLAVLVPERDRIGTTRSRGADTDSHDDVPVISA